MKPKRERLAEQQGDFGPPHQPVDELVLERLLDRYGLSLICDYPQILFERRDRLFLSGRRRTFQQDREYPRSSYDWMPYLARDGLANWRYRDNPQTLIDRMREAYRILDEIYAPVPKPTSQSDQRRGYKKSGNQSY